MIYAPRRLPAISSPCACGFIAGTNSSSPAAGGARAEGRRADCLTRMADRVDGAGRCGGCGDASYRGAALALKQEWPLRRGSLPAAALILTALALTSFRAPWVVFLIWAMVAVEEGAMRLVLRDGLSGTLDRIGIHRPHRWPGTRAPFKSGIEAPEGTSHRLPRQPGCLRCVRTWQAAMGSPRRRNLSAPL